MEDTPTTAVARRFLQFLNEGQPPSNKEIARVLDELALAYHAAPPGDPSEEDVDPPKVDYQKRYRALERRFPQLGYYGIAEPTEIPPEEPLIGDAIDDLADIAADLEQVLWRSEHVGLDDAHWYFRMLFEIHWGRHLRQLALYLHASISEDD